MSDWTFHGGRLSAAVARFGGDPVDWLDLSTGINPDPWPGASTLAIDWHRLPDEGALAQLETVAAQAFGVAPAQCCAVPGTEIGLRLAGMLIGGPARHVVPSYRTHAAMIPGSQPIPAAQLPVSGDANLILAQPNNPDGQVVPPEVLEPQIATLATSPHWLMVDQAFVDSTPALSLAGHVRDDRRLLLFRSFGKFFGLAGVRLGFVLGPAPFLAALRERLGAWSVSAAALAIGTAAYADSAWNAGTVARLAEQAAELDAVLARHGLSPQGECPLFRLVRTPDASALFERLAARRILTRPFDDDSHGLRFGLPGNAAALDRLDWALRG